MQLDKILALKLKEYDMANIIKGYEIIDAWTDNLNDICRQDGGITRDDTRIWEIMHAATTDDWDNMLGALENIYKISPGTFKAYHVKNMQDARQALDKSRALGKDFVGRPHIAKSGNKAAAWKTVMTMREVVNDYNGIYVPNRAKD